MTRFWTLKRNVLIIQNRLNDFVSESEAKNESAEKVNFGIIKDELDSESGHDIFEQVYLNESKTNCSFCTKSPKEVQALKSHKTSKHETSNTIHKCPLSGCKAKSFVTKKRLQNHLKTHNEDTKEICSYCGLIVANKHNLEKHINRVHLKLRNFECDLCEYRGVFKFNIVEHVS